MKNLSEFLPKVMKHAMISHALATKTAEELNIASLKQKAANDEIEPTLDALTSIGAIKPEQRKTAAAHLADHASALIKLRKLAEMIKGAGDKESVNGPGVAVGTKTAGDRSVIKTARDEANDEFVACL